MRKKSSLFLYVIVIFSLFLNNCSKGPIVTDIVRGIYDNTENNKKKVS